MPKEKGRSLSDENLQIVIDHVNKYRETREILLCINSSGFESEQKEAIRQKLDERLGDKAQQVKVIDLLEYDWSSVDQGWEIDGKDISIKDYYANMYSKAPGERMYFPDELDNFRMVALALSKQITGKRGAIYVDFDTLSAIKEPLGQDITIPKGILVGDVGENFVNNDLIAIDRPEIVINFLNRYNYEIESEKMLCQRAKKILKLDYDGKSLNDLLEMYARGNLNKALYFLFCEKGRFLIITHLEFSNYIQYFAKFQRGHPYYSAKSVSFKHNGGKYPDDSKAFHNYSWLDIPSRKIREERLKIEEYISLAKKEEASKGIRELANYIRSMGYKFETKVTTFLHLAIRIQDKSLVKDLIEMGDDVNARDSHGKTPLHLAAEMGDLSLVSLLLKNGAVFNVQNAESLMPKSLSKPGEVLTLLTNVEQAFQLANVGIPVIHLTLLKHAIENLSDVQVLAKAKNKDGKILLSLVVSRKSNLLEVQEKRLEIIDLLVDKGADINFKDAQGNSLLYTAISNTDKKVVGALLKKGAVIDDATKLIVKGMKAIPNPNEDIKAILEKLEQHRLRINECAPSGSGRGKRAAGSNCDAIHEDFGSMLKRKIDDIQHSLAHLRDRMQFIHDRITFTLEHVTVLDSLEQMHRRLVRNMDDTNKDLAISRSNLENIKSNFRKLVDEAARHEMVIGGDVDYEKINAVKQEIRLEDDNYDNTLQEMSPKLEDTKLLIKRVENTIKLVEEARTVKVRLNHYTQLLKDYYDGKVDAIAVKNGFQDLQEAIAKIDLIGKGAGKRLTRDIRFTKIQGNADKGIKRIEQYQRLMTFVIDNIKSDYSESLEFLNEKLPLEASQPIRDQITELRTVIESLKKLKDDLTDIRSAELEDLAGKVNVLCETTGAGRRKRAAGGGCEITDESIESISRNLDNYMSERSTITLNIIDATGSLLRGSSNAMKENIRDAKLLLDLQNSYLDSVSSAIALHRSKNRHNGAVLDEGAEQQLNLLESKALEGRRKNADLMSNVTALEDSILAFEKIREIKERLNPKLLKDLSGEEINGLIDGELEKVEVVKKELARIIEGGLERTVRTSIKNKFEQEIQRVNKKVSDIQSFASL